ncbi:3'-5' exonuclease [Salipaludibacillus sp. CF4.18]|uniref:3'-5' exonuclease n=1 Tax=Salipaludibacillus sp. CF4.18 TaxID=3373081 RepID=UPI003EE708B4
MNFVALDFETASREKGSVCAIGMVRVVNDEIVDEKYALIRPQNPYFDPYFEQVHGITWDDVKEEPTFDQLWPELSGYFHNNLIVAHNAAFDINVLRNVLDHYSIPYPMMKYNCTVSIAKKTWPEFINHKLNTIAYHFDMDFEHHHALEDARVAAHIILKASEIYNAFDEETFLQRLDLCHGIISEEACITPGMNKKKQKSIKKNLSKKGS